MCNVVEPCWTGLSMIQKKEKKTNCPFSYYQNPEEVLEEFLDGDVLWVPGTLEEAAWPSGLGRWI